MSSILSAAPPLVMNLSDIERLKGQKGLGLEAEKKRLKKATREFESMVVYEMLKTMRKTIPENTLTESEDSSGGLGKDIYTQMFDMELARKVSTGDKNSISEVLYNQVVKSVEARYQDNSILKAIIQPSKVDSKHMQLNKKNFIENQNNFKEINRKSDLDNFKPISIRKIRSSSTKTDNIVARFGDIIEMASRETKLDSALIASVIKVESNGNPKAVSKAGAKGLMQLIDVTAEEMGVKKVFNPKENILAGSKYLKKMIDRFGDIKLGLAAYNAGAENVKKYGDIPPFAETREYVTKVLENMERYQNNSPM